MLLLPIDSSDRGPEILEDHRYGVTNHPSPQDLQDKGNVPLEEDCTNNTEHLDMWLHKISA